MGTYMKMSEYVSGCDGSGPEFTYELSMNSLRNDRWLNSHMYGLMQIWLANMDFQLVVDVNKVVNYMTKYVCKPEMEMSKGLSNMVKKLINVGHHTGLGLRGIFKKMMFNLIGSRTISKQESCHLSLGTPMVSCSHMFVKISLTSSFKKLTLKKKENYDPTKDLEKPSILEMYMRRTNKDIWESNYVYEMYKDRYDIFNMSLYEFAKTLYIRNKSGVEKNI